MFRTSVTSVRGTLGITHKAKESLFQGIVTLLLLLAPLQAQEPSALLPDGTLIRAKVKGKCSTRSARVGDEITLTVIQDVLGADGKAVIPKKSKLIGQVAEVQKYEKNKASSHLFLLVQYAMVGNKRVNLHAHLDSLELLRTTTYSRGHEELPRPVMPGTIADPREVQQPGGSSDGKPRRETASNVELRQYRLAHVAFAASSGSKRKDMLVSRITDIELTAQDAIIVLRHAQD